MNMLNHDNPVNPVPEQVGVERRNSSSPFKVGGILLIVFSAFLIAGGVIGFLTSKSVVEKKHVFVMSESHGSSIPEEVIGNPMFTSDWSGKIKGRIVNKSNDFIELKSIDEIYTNLGQRITQDSENPNLTKITIRQNMTEFLLRQTDSAENTVLQELTVQDLNIGEIVEGNIKIEIDQVSGEPILIGSALSVYK